jgi:hypothetical protein
VRALAWEKRKEYRRSEYSAEERLYDRLELLEHHPCPTTQNGIPTTNPTTALKFGVNNIET